MPAQCIAIMTTMCTQGICVPAAVHMSVYDTNSMHDAKRRRGRRSILSMHGRPLQQQQHACRAFGMPASVPSAGNMSVHEAGYFRMIKTAVEAAKLRRSRKLLTSSPCCAYHPSGHLCLLAVSVLIVAQTPSSNCPALLNSRSLCVVREAWGRRAC